MAQVTNYHKNRKNALDTNWHIIIILQSNYYLGWTRISLIKMMTQNDLFSLLTALISRTWVTVKIRKVLWLQRNLIIMLTLWILKYTAVTF